MKRTAEDLVIVYLKGKGPQCTDPPAGKEPTEPSGRSVGELPDFPEGNQLCSGQQGNPGTTRPKERWPESRGLMPFNRKGSLRGLTGTRERRLQPDPEPTEVCHHLPLVGTEEGRREKGKEEGEEEGGEEEGGEEAATALSEHNRGAKKAGSFSPQGPPSVRAPGFPRPPCRQAGTAFGLRGAAGGQGGAEGRGWSQGRAWPVLTVRR